VSHALHDLLAIVVNNVASELAALDHCLNKSCNSNEHEDRLGPEVVSTLSNLCYTVSAMGRMVEGWHLLVWMTFIQNCVGKSSEIGVSILKSCLWAKSTFENSLCHLNKYQKRLKWVSMNPSAVVNSKKMSLSIVECEKNYETYSVAIQKVIP